MSAAPRPRGFGCLTIFAVMCLGAFSLAEVGVVMWLNPDWFDRIAFWRGEIYEPDPVATKDPATREALAKKDQEILNSLVETADPGRLIAFDPAAIEGKYDPTSGLRMTNPAGAEFSIPPGALPDAASVTMTPLVSVPAAMAAEFGGPSYEIRVGNAEHTAFRAPATLTLPYLPEISRDPAIAVWENGQWRPLDTHVDPVTKKVTAQVPHLSVLTVLRDKLSWRARLGVRGGVVLLGFLLATDGTVKGNVRAASWWLDGVPKLETPNFVVHYFTKKWYDDQANKPQHPKFPRPREKPTYEHAVSEDSAYPNAGGRKAGEHPLMVQDIGEWLEQARARLEALGVPLPKPTAIRYDVFLINMPDYGSTMMGGPVFISTKIPEFAAKANHGVENSLRATVAHELVHVAQDTWFRFDQGQRWRWYMEASAAYLGDRCWEPDFAPDMVRRGYLMMNVSQSNLLPATAMDMAADTDYYAHATFFTWLDRKHNGAGLKLVQLANSQGDATLAGLDGAARKAVGSGLGDLFTQFAQDFYHDDIWHGETTPKPHRGMTPHAQLIGQMYRTGAGNKDIPDMTFAYPARGGQRHDWALTPVRRMQHLSAHALYVRTEDALPALRKPKLVVSLEPNSEGNAPTVYLAEDKIAAGSLPLKGAPAAFTAFDGPSGFKIVDDFATKAGKNGVTIIVVNQSLDKEASGIFVRRWLLLAPAFVEAEREEPAPGLHSRHWTVKWHRTELKDFPEAFKGYNVYRRKWGEPDSAFVRVKENVPDEIHTDHAPDDEDYAYMVRVVDSLGNESADSPVEKSDPFQGVWEGEFKLVEGSLIEPAVRAFKRIGEETEQKELASIAKEPDPARQAERRRQWEETKKRTKELFDSIVQLLRLGEQLARVGIPLQMKIRRTGGEYYVTFPEVVWQSTGMTDEDAIAMTREGQHTLQVKKMPPDFPPLQLRLHRKDEIRGSYTFEYPVENGKKEKVAIKWSFDRKGK